MKNILKKTYIIFSCTYTALTILSSIINLILGKSYDSYIHLIDRAIIILIPILLYFIVKKVKINKYVKILIHYILTILLAMIETFIIGIITKDLASTAYRDQFLNYSIVYIIIIIIMIFEKNKK